MSAARVTWNSNPPDGSESQPSSETMPAPPQERVPPESRVVARREPATVPAPDVDRNLDTIPVDCGPDLPNDTIPAPACDMYIADVIARTGASAMGFPPLPSFEEEAGTKK